MIVGAAYSFQPRNKQGKPVGEPILVDAVRVVLNRPCGHQYISPRMINSENEDVKHFHDYIERQVCDQCNRPIYLIPPKLD